LGLGLTSPLEAHQCSTYPLVIRQLTPLHKGTASLTAFDGATAVITGPFSLDALLYGLSIQRMPKRRNGACYTLPTNFFEHTKSH
jgi:hypothetical protein